MVEWGAFRRSAVRVVPGLLLTPFIPRYETAVYDGPTTLSFKPHVTILYADEETAFKGWDELAKIIEDHGLIGLEVLSGPDDPRKEAWFLGVPDRSTQLSNRAIELVGDVLAVPGQDGVRPSNVCHLAEKLATQSTTDLAERCSLGVRDEGTSSPGSASARQGN